MKNIKYVLFLALVMFTSTLSVSAATITKAEYDDAFKIEGTGTGQIQIVIFDKENEPIYMTTATAVNDKYSITLPKISGLENGDYKVKVADYAGATDAVAKTVTVNVDKVPPKTGDTIMVSIIFSIISILSLIGISLFIKNKRYN